MARALTQTEIIKVTLDIRSLKRGETLAIRDKTVYDYVVEQGLSRNTYGSVVFAPLEDFSTGSNEFTAANEPMLHRAEQLINGKRLEEYGSTLINFDQIADFWNAHLKYKLAPGCKVTAEDVALMMIGVKQARLAKTPTHEDSVLDIAGYIGCYDKILSERRTRDEALIPRQQS